MTFEKKLVLMISIIALVSFVIDAQFHRTILNAIGCGLLGITIVITFLIFGKK